MLSARGREEGRGENDSELYKLIEKADIETNNLRMKLDEVVAENEQL